MKTKKPITVVRYALIVAVSTMLGISGASAFAAGQNPSDSGAGDSTNSQSKEWQTNASGQTFGSLVDVEDLNNAPDLIQAETTDGDTGYVYMNELNSASGGNVNTPEEALEFQNSMDALAKSGKKLFIPVYDQEGVIVLGEFEIAPSPSNQRQ